MSEAPAIDDLDAAERTKVRRGRRRWAFVAGMVLSAGLALWVTYLAIVAADRHTAEAALQRLRDAGDPVTPEEMHAFYQTSPEIERATSHWQRAMAGQGWVSDYPGWEAVPIVGRAQPTLDERGLYDEATSAVVEPFLASRETTLREAHLAREAGGVARLPLPFEGPEDELPTHTAELRALANLMILDAQARAARGDLSGATDSLLTVLATSESMANQPLSIYLLIRVAILNLAVHYTTTLIQAADFPEEDLIRLQAAFARQDLHSHFLRAMRGEQFITMQVFEMPHGIPLRGADQAMAVAIWQEFLTDAEPGLPEARAATDRREARVAQLDASRLDQWRYRLAILSIGGGPTLHATITSQAEARIGETAIACERYRQDRGDWPSTLEALVPDYLAAVPLDPLDDQPLRYERRTERVVIFSLVHDHPANRAVKPPRNGFGSRVLGQPFTEADRPPEPPNVPWPTHPGTR